MPEIPSDWLVTRLGDITLDQEYGLTESAEEYDSEKPRYVRTQDFNDRAGLKEDSRASLSWGKAEGALLEPGDLLFARSGSVGASLGKIYLYDPDDGDCCYGGYSIRHRIQTEGLNHQYLAQFCLSRRYWDWIRRRAKTTAQSNINTGEYASLPIPVPPLEEQRKIASVLHNLDQLIAQTDRTLTRRRRIRGELLNKLVVGDWNSDRPTQTAWIGARSYEVPEGWEVESLGDLCEEITKGTTPTTHGFEYTDDGILFIKAESIDEEGHLLGEKSEYIGEEADERLSRSRLSGGDLLISIAGALGKVMQVQEEYLPANINQALSLVRLNSSRANRSYVRYFLEGSPIQKQITSISTMTAQSNLNLKQVSELPVFLPGAKEQERISEILGRLDRTIQVEQAYRSRYQGLKQGLMQDLLSGAVRTHDKDIDVLLEVKQHG